MRFSILEAKEENSSIFLTGYFNPKKDSIKDTEVLRIMISEVQQGHFAWNKNIKLEQGTIFVRNIILDNLIAGLTMLNNIGISVRLTSNIRYFGDIDEARFQEIIKKIICKSDMVTRYFLER